MLTRTLWNLGEVEQAETVAQEAIVMARAIEHPYTLAFALAFLSWFYSAAHNAERTLELTNEAIMVSTQYSFALGLAMATTSQGWALAENEPEHGLGKLLKGLSAIRITGATIYLTFALALLAEVYLRNHRFEEGFGAIEEAQKLAGIGGELFWQSELFRLKGELLLGQSDQSISEAAQCFTEALKVARNQHARMLELRAATSLARLFKKLHKVDEAERVLNAACSWFGDRSANPDLVEAQTVRDQLRI